MIVWFFNLNCNYLHVFQLFSSTDRHRKSHFVSARILRSTAVVCSCIFCLFFCPSHLLSSPSVVSLPPINSRNSDAGSHHGWLLYPHPHFYGSCLAFLCFYHDEKISALSCVDNSRVELCQSTLLVDALNNFVDPPFFLRINSKSH